MQQTSVLFVCLGNICRSPMAEGIFRKLVEGAGATEAFRIDSAGTAAYHAGERPDPRSQDVLARHDAPCLGRARQVRPRDFRDFDLILAMDQANLSDLSRICPADQAHKVKLVLEPMGGGEVADPYYGGPGGFDRNYAELEEALGVWLQQLQ